MGIEYLIDENLPDQRIPVWQAANFIHQRAIEPSRHDSSIWRYARAHGLTVVTKDQDFAELVLAPGHVPPPRVIVLRLGGMKLADMRDFLAQNWPAIVQLSTLNKLVNVFPTFLQGVN